MGSHQFSAVTLCSWQSTSHLARLVTLLIKPKLDCLECNLYSWMCSFPLNIPVDIPSQQEGLLNLIFQPIIHHIRMASQIAAYLCFTPFQMSPHAPFSAFALWLWIACEIMRSGNGHTVTLLLWKPRREHYCKCIKCIKRWIDSNKNNKNISIT